MPAEYAHPRRHASARVYLLESLPSGLLIGRRDLLGKIFERDARHLALGELIHHRRRRRHTVATSVKGEGKGKGKGKGDGDTDKGAAKCTKRTRDERNERTERKANHRGV